MSFLNDFEGRISSVFGAAPQGYTEPFSFKKLAKRAAREMENETYEIDGVDTAPASTPCWSPRPTIPSCARSTSRSPTRPAPS